MGKDIDKKFEQLEKKLNIATELVDELSFPEYELVDVVDAELVLPEPKELAVVEESTEVFSLATLKSDFVMIRQNVMKLIGTGQRILDSVSVIDVDDMKASQLQALSQLQGTLGSNMQLLVSIYKEICEIERMRLGLSGKPTEGGTVQQLNSGNVTNNNTIVFSGDTNELLNIIKQNQIS